MLKKVLMRLSMLVVAVAMIVGGTMAWFTDADSAGEATFAAGTLSIAANQKISFDEEEGSEYEWQKGDVFPNKVVGYFQGRAGINKDKDVAPVRSNPNAVLSLESGKDESNFFSLGFGGHIIVEFFNIIMPKQSIVVVVEDTWGGNYPLEKAEVYASQDGEEWVPIGLAKNNPKSGNQYENHITMPEEEELAWAKYIKLVDTTDPEDFKGYTTTDKTIDGFDVNAIYVEGSYFSKTMNWNPGDCSEKVYTIQNTGSKGIHLRGKFEGKWLSYNEKTYTWESWTPDPDDGVVAINLNDSTSWTQVGNYFYYNNSIPGTYQNEGIEEVSLTIKVCLDGEGTGNQYQGKRFVLSSEFEAIQASNGASTSAGWGFIPN